MGPRLDRRGNGLAAVLVRAELERASMGPRLDRRGNGFALRDHHGVVRDASMGPRLDRRGNTYVLQRATVEEATLQWGHVLIDVETARV